MHPNKHLTPSNAIRGLEKLNNYNYDLWHTCMESYLQGQDLWEIVGGIKTTALTPKIIEALRKWSIKVGKAIFAKKMRVQKEKWHIREANTRKATWNTL